MKMVVGSWQEDVEGCVWRDERRLTLDASGLCFCLQKMFTLASLGQHFIAVFFVDIEVVSTHNTSLVGNHNQALQMQMDCTEARQYQRCGGTEQRPARIPDLN